MGWIWRKGVSVGKKVIAATFVLSSVPFVVPPLVVASTIALISSLPYCIFLASYVCTEKLMRKLLPPSAFGRRCDHKIILLPNKIGHGDIYYQGITRVAMSVRILVQTPVMRKMMIRKKSQRVDLKPALSLKKAIEAASFGNQVSK